VLFENAASNTSDIGRREELKRQMSEFNRKLKQHARDKPSVVVAASDEG
jgi:hypothetical protein